MGGNFEELLKKARAEKGGEPYIEEPEEEIEETTQPEKTDVPQHQKPKKKGNRLVRAIVTFIVVLALCGGAAYTIIAGVFDFTALNKSDTKVDVTVSEGATTAQIAAALHENGLIDHPWMFRLYSKLSGRDGSYQAGTYSLSANMGYQLLSTTIILGKPRNTVSVTIPEGYTVDKIAKLLESKNVCTTADCYDALLHENFSYDFFADIPDSADGGVYEGRIYRLEGYLFPDTYEFYTESAGKTVINKLLANFDAKVTPAMRSAMQAKGLKLDDVVIMASIAQKEAVAPAEMPKVTRVLYNRLSSDYKRLECDSTSGYVADLLPTVAGQEIVSTAYDTYKRYGLPAGAICNPGEDALKAAIYPSDDSYIAECYFFANDTKGNTYYSKTYAQHVATCRKYKIGIHG